MDWNENIVKNLTLFKIILLTLVGAGSGIAAEHEVTDMLPLVNFTERNNLKDPAAALYVYDRCISLFITFTTGAKNQKGPVAEDFIANARAAYVAIAKVEALFLFVTSKDADAALTEHTEVVKRLQKEYSNRMNRIVDLGHDLMDDEILGGDLKICAEVAKRAQNEK